MGNPLSSVFCDIYMKYFEEKLFNKHKFSYCYRYVDDILILVPPNTDIFNKLPSVSLIACCVQFTFEVKKQQISFIF